jgi:aromatic ring-cleaving dioxygenase
MSDSKTPSNIHDAYHAHVYFDKQSADNARNLCDQADNNFDVVVGRFHQKLIGPHPQWSCQIAFNQSEFDGLIPWLDKNRKGLTILVHGSTGNDLKDHTDYAYWLGESVELNLQMFQ